MRLVQLFMHAGDSAPIHSLILINRNLEDAGKAQPIQCKCKCSNAQVSTSSCVVAGCLRMHTTAVPSPHVGFVELVKTYGFRAHAGFVELEYGRQLSRARLVARRDRGRRRREVATWHTTSLGLAPLGTEKTSKGGRSQRHCCLSSAHSS